MTSPGLPEPNLGAGSIGCSSFTAISSEVNLAVGSAGCSSFAGVATGTKAFRSCPASRRR